ncbi:MAG: nucleotidyl transferase AbiEii/AbiGii toxin family protein [bacterium]
MFTFEQIKKKYPEEIARRNPRAILVEYLQVELLDSLFKQSASENLSFIGGTAIRIVYNSSRFSEDLDFDNFGLSFKDFDKLLTETAHDMQKKGFELEFRMVEKGAYHCYVKFAGLLAPNNISNHANEKVLVRIYAVHKKSIIKPKYSLLDLFDVYRNILTNPPEIILAQKLITILERKREKGRDFYDVSYLLGIAEPNYDYLEKEYGVKKIGLKKKILDKIENLDMNNLAKDILPFLIKPNDKERILSFREYIKQRL